MKKLIHFTAILCLITLMLGSCNTPEEVYNTKCKLYKIWERSEVGEPDMVLNYDKKERITSITYIDSLNPKPMSFTFNYPDDKSLLISEIIYLDEYGKTETIKLTYDTDNYLKDMEYSIDGVLRQTSHFTRRDNHTVASILTQFDLEFFRDLDNELNNPSKFYKMFINENTDFLKILAKNQSKELVLKIMTYVFFDEEGKNVVKTISTIPSERQQWDIEYSYSDKKTLSFNPFYEIPFAFGNLKSFSLNNPKTEKQIYSYHDDNDKRIIEERLYSFEYQLNEKKFPRNVRTMYQNVPTNTYYLYLLNN